MKDRHTNQLNNTNINLNHSLILAINRFIPNCLRYLILMCGAFAGQALIYAAYPGLVNIKALFKAYGGVKTINKFFLYAANKMPDYTNTINDVVTAQKPATAHEN